MVNTIIDLIHEVKQKFERIIDRTTDEWIDKYNFEDAYIDDTESWYEQDGEQLIYEFGLTIANEVYEEETRWEVTVILNSDKSVEVNICRSNGEDAKEINGFVLDKEWFRQKLEYRFARAFTL